MYMPNNIVKTDEAKTERTVRRIDKSTIIVGDFNTPLRNRQIQQGRISVKT